MSCWQFNLLACLLVHLKNTFLVHYYSSPANLIHHQEKDTWQRVWDKVIYSDMGDKTISSKENINLEYRIFSYFHSVFLFFIFEALGTECKVLCHPNTLSLNCTLGFLLFLFQILVPNFTIFFFFVYILETFGLEVTCLVLEYISL